jgi:hypothetical protein
MPGQLPDSLLTPNFKGPVFQPFSIFSLVGYTPSWLLCSCTITTVWMQRIYFGFDLQLERCHQIFLSTKFLLPSGCSQGKVETWIFSADGSSSEIKNHICCPSNVKLSLIQVESMIDIRVISSWELISLLPSRRFEVLKKIRAMLSQR